MDSVWKKGLSVVVPAYNQGEVLEKNIRHIQGYLKQKGALFEIIIVNDGSTDQTKKILTSIQQELSLNIFTHEKNLGKGKAVATGVLAAQFPRVLFLDADLAIPIESTEPFLEALEQGKDIVIASRFVPGNAVETKVLWYRQILEKIYWLLRRCIIGIDHIKDTQCGYKLFHTEIAKDIFSQLTCNRFSFDTEILYIATVKGYTIKELPITLQNPTRSSIRIVRDSAQMFFDLLKIRYLRLRGAYTALPSKAPITFDDFGINEVTNKRIVTLLEHPRVKRVSVMMSGEWSTLQKEALVSSGKLLDIHLELPGNKDLERKVHGDFLSRFCFFIAQILKREYTRKKIESSWKEQIESFQKEFGKYPDGINSHEHVHFFPIFFPIVQKLAEQYNIPFIRLGRKYVMHFSFTAFVLGVLRIININALGLKNIQTSSSMLSYDWGINVLDEADERSEILYHVERDEEYIQLFSRLTVTTNRF